MIYINIDLAADIDGNTSRHRLHKFLPMRPSKGFRACVSRSAERNRFPCIQTRKLRILAFLSEHINRTQRHTLAWARSNSGKEAGSLNCGCHRECGGTRFGEAANVETIWPFWSQIHPIMSLIRGESELPVVCETFHQRVAEIFNNLQLAGLGGVQLNIF